MARTSSPASARLGETIRELRTAREMSVDRLAVESGVESSTLRSYETGRAMLSMRTLFKIAEALRVEPGELLIGISSAMFEPEVP